MEKTTNKVIIDLAKHGFSDYRGRKFRLVVVPDNHEFRVSTYWDSGSIRYYALLEIATKKDLQFVPSGTYPRFEDDIIMLKPGLSLIQHSISCGKDMGLTIYITESDIKTLIIP